MDLPRTPITELIEDLWFAAEHSILSDDGIPSHETTEGEAAQTLEELELFPVR